MKKYIFITAEGYTYSPNSDEPEPEIENCQVLGFEKGNNETEAFENFVLGNQHLKDMGFKDVICYELMKQEPALYFSIDN
ncbi:MAG: hypothetical protein IT281_01705 [Ignavibacteria bacterium]|nr:hypothetical protein [Ignavibacteria bacterium]MCC7158233.1 hypothetical protein [Ignavibacteria bacterium]